MNHDVSTCTCTMTCVCPSPTVLRNICLCTTIGGALLIFALLMASYAPYHYYLEGSENCQANYILSTDIIQCGYGNSLQYDGANIEGCPVDGDVMTETLNAWQIRDDELILYSQTLLPVKSNGLTTDHLTFLLLGWQIDVERLCNWWILLHCQ